MILAEAEALTRPANIFRDIPKELPEELSEILISADSLRIERIVSRGQATPPGQWYDQADDEWVLLLSGSAGLRREDREEPITLKPGDHLFLPAGCRHRVEWTKAATNTVWLAVHFRGR